MTAGRKHRYRVDVLWTGNRGTGTDGYRSYSRNHVVRVPGKADLNGSADPTFHGDATRHNPEDMLVAALSTCHMLSYLHMAMMAGVVVTEYHDAAEGSMVVEGNGGHFVEVVLRPVVTIRAASDPSRAQAVHDDAHHACFIANSVNFPVRCEPRIVVASV